MPALFQIVEQYRSLERLDASDDMPVEVIRDTLEGLTGDLTVKATNVAKFILNLESFAEAVKGAAEQMAERSKRIQRKADQIREYLKVNMEGAKILKIEATEFTLSVRANPPSVVIDDEAKIPPDFKVTDPPPPPPQPRPDKKKIADALKAHAKLVEALKDGDAALVTPVPGAHLEVATRLQVKA